MILVGMIVSPSNVYECVPCSDPLMVVADGECSCNGTYTLSGSSCILTSTLQQLQNEFSSLYATVQYNDLVSGSTSQNTLQSQVFSTHFYDSAAACQDSETQGNFSKTFDHSRPT